MEPLIIREQLDILEATSVTINVKLIIPSVSPDLFWGEMRVTFGGVKSDTSSETLVVLEFPSESFAKSSIV